MAFISRQIYFYCHLRLRSLKNNLNISIKIFRFLKISIWNYISMLLVTFLINMVFLIYLLIEKMERRRRGTERFSPHWLILQMGIKATYGSNRSWYLGIPSLFPTYTVGAQTLEPTLYCLPRPIIRQLDHILNSWNSQSKKPLQVVTCWAVSQHWPCKINFQPYLPHAISAYQDFDLSFYLSLFSGIFTLLWKISTLSPVESNTK